MMRIKHLLSCAKSLSLETTTRTKPSHAEVTRTVALLTARTILRRAHGRRPRPRGRTTHAAAAYGPHAPPQMWRDEVPGSAPCGGPAGHPVRPLTCRRLPHAAGPGPEQHGRDAPSDARPRAGIHAAITTSIGFCPRTRPVETRGTSRSITVTQPGAATREGSAGPAPGQTPHEGDVVPARAAGGVVPGP